MWCSLSIIVLIVLALTTAWYTQTSVHNYEWDWTLVYVGCLLMLTSRQLFQHIIISTVVKTMEACNWSLQCMYAWLLGWSHTERVQNYMYLIHQKASCVPTAILQPNHYICAIHTYEYSGGTQTPWYIDWKPHHQLYLWCPHVRNTSESISKQWYNSITTKELHTSR